MAFGMNTGGGGSGGEFLGRINFDVRVGFWKVTDRVEEDGQFVSRPGAPRPDAAFLFDYGSFEVGWIKIDSSPTFLLAPWGQAVPARPEEKKKNDNGKEVFSFMPGFRVKVMGQMFGDGEPRYFGGNSGTLNDAVEDLIFKIEAAPEAAQGLVPVVSSTANRPVQIKTPKGTNTFYAPVFQITQWVPRPARLGERLVPPPAPRAAPVTAAPAYAPPPPPPVAPAPTAAMPF